MDCSAYIAMGIKYVLIKAIGGNNKKCHWCRMYMEGKHKTCMLQRLILDRYFQSNYK